MVRLYFLYRYLYYLLRRRKGITYTIKKGDHYASVFRKIPDKVIPFTGNSLKFEFEINESWKHLPMNCVSKVYGFTEGRVHQNSCRLGVRPVMVGENKYYDLVGYVYCDGKSPNDYKGLKVYLLRAQLHDKILANLFRVADRYYFELYNTGSGFFSGSRWTLAGRDRKVGSICFPYAGGEDPADGDVKITITEIKGYL